MKNRFFILQQGILNGINLGFNLDLLSNKISYHHHQMKHREEN